MQELETVFLANNWLCQMDLALLHVPLGLDMLKEAVFYCINQSDLPILVLHNADEEGHILVEQMRTWLKQGGLNTGRILDLGARKETEPQDMNKPTRLMPHDLARWLLKRFDVLGIPVKFTPTISQIRQDIRDQFERCLQEELLKDMGEKFRLLHLIIDLDARLSFTQLMIDEALDEQLKKSLKQNACTMSYATILNTIVESFFERFMSQIGAKVWQLEQTWLTKRQGEWI